MRTDQKMKRKETRKKDDMKREETESWKRLEHTRRREKKEKKRK